MLSLFLSCLYFSICMAVKGGWHTKLKTLKSIEDRSTFFKILLDGRWLSTAMVVLYAMPFLGPYGAFICGLGWFLGIIDSMGEEAGAIGGWGQYVESDEFGRTYGIKKAVQRGAWFGVPLAILTLYTGWLWAGLMFVPCYWLGITAKKRLVKQDGWDWAEPIFGIFFGLAFESFIHGKLWFS